MSGDHTSCATDMPPQAVLRLILTLGRGKAPLTAQVTFLLSLSPGRDQDINSVLSGTSEKGKVGAQYTIQYSKVL